MASNCEYYDIVLLGKTGQGKSTIGNQLLETDHTPEAKIGWRFGSFSGIDTAKRFLQADHVLPESSYFLVTKTCQVLSNEITGIRVLDAPGFADSDTLKKQNMSIYQGNLQTIGRVARAQLQANMQAKRVLYFLPTRGPLKKVDGMLLEELQVMYHSFGEDVFDCMVVIATNSPKESQQRQGFNEEDMKVTTDVFHTALKEVIPDKECPPIVYVALKEESNELVRKIKDAPVLRDIILPLKFKDDVCARCSIKIRFSNHGDHCEKIGIVGDDGNVIPFSETKCHPCFENKYTGTQRFFGGVAHVLTLGIGLLVEHLTDSESWPGWTNTDEECPVCKKSPGAEGCSKACESVTLPGDKYKGLEALVEHTNELK